MGHYLKSSLKRLGAIDVVYILHWKDSWVDDKGSLFPHLLMIEMAMAKSEGTDNGLDEPTSLISAGFNPAFFFHPTYPILYLYCYLVSILIYLDYWRVLTLQ